VDVTIARSLLFQMSTYRLNTLATLALVALLLVQLAIAQSDIYQYEQKRQGASKYCGKHLSNALQLVCHGLYNSMFKKSGQGSCQVHFTLLAHLPTCPRAPPLGPQCHCFSSCPSERASATSSERARIAPPYSRRLTAASHSMPTRPGREVERERVSE
jgi:hypothetical protein